MTKTVRTAALALALFAAAVSPLRASVGGERFDTTQSRVVKVYGQGGVSGLEGYRSGVIVSPDGVILTVDGSLLESGEAIVVLANGDRYSGRVTGVDPLTGVAVLRVESGPDAGAEDASVALPHFDLAAARDAASGEEVSVISNAFNIATGPEPLSLQRGVIAGVTPVGALRGGPPLLERAPLLVLDCVTSNPGAAGGAVVGARGDLLGMVGGELRSEATGAWVNYALPTPLLREALERSAATEGDVGPVGEPESTLPRLGAYGVSLIPRVTERTPPYIEHVVAGSPAANAGLRTDDLIVLVGGRAAPTVAAAATAILDGAERSESVTVTVLRGDALIEFKLPSIAEEKP